MKIIKLASILLVAFLIISSCSKDQKYVKWLAAGDWERTDFTLNGEDVEAQLGYNMVSHVQTHSECRVKDAECDGTTTYVVDRDGVKSTGSAAWTYKIYDNGTKMAFTTLSSTVDGVTTPCTVGCVNETEIVEMSKDKYITSYTDENGDVWVRTHERT